jgi:hypothetical protein
VLNSFSREAMTPGASLDAVDERNVGSVKNKVVDIARRVRSGDRGKLARLDPLTVDSDRVTLGDGETSREGDQALGSTSSNLDNTKDSS